MSALARKSEGFPGEKWEEMVAVLLLLVLLLVLLVAVPPLLPVQLPSSSPPLKDHKSCERGADH